MNAQHISTLDLFAENAQKIKREFVWQNMLLKRLAALLYAAENKPVDNAAIRRSYDLIKQNTGLFSTFRGNAALSVATLLSLSENQAKLLADTLKVYGSMKDAGFSSSDYLAVASYLIAAHSKPELYPEVIRRARQYYEKMKEDHFFLTGQNDYIFTAMLGLSETDIDSTTTRMEELYRQLKPSFSSGNGVQALTQVLVLGGEVPETTARVLALQETLRGKKLRLDREYTLSSLGVLALLPGEVADLAGDVEETYRTLRRKDGFGEWAVTKEEMLLFSTALVAFNHTEDMKKEQVTAALSTSITLILLAQQTAIAAVAASSAAAAAAASSSS